jgi:WD40 repeat protein
LAEIGEGCSAMAISPDGKLLASGRYHTITLWDTETWQPKFTINDRGLGPVNTLAFSPDGQVLAAGVAPVVFSGTIVFYDIATGQKLQSFADPDGIWKIVWLEGGNLVATSDKGGVLRLFGILRN